MEARDARAGAADTCVLSRKTLITITERWRGREKERRERREREERERA